MLRLIVASVLCLLLGGCAGGYEWVKPEMTAATREADISGCGGKASHLAKDDVEAVAIVDRCMAARGYVRQPASKPAAR